MSETLRVTSSGSMSFSKKLDDSDMTIQEAQINTGHESPSNKSIGSLDVSTQIITNHQNENISSKKSDKIQKPEKCEVSRLSDQIIEEHGVSDEEEESHQQSQPKILIQRVFRQLEKHVVQPKLDYVIANSEKEITKHVFGGLFNTKYYPYIPENYCKKHAPNLFEYINEALPKIGDKFDTLESFRLYVDSQAKQWKYYLKCADSHRGNGKDTFVYKCVLARPRSAVVTRTKVIRRRTRKLPLHNCPCRVLLKPVPTGAKDLTVIYVCNHHDHPLTDDYFSKLQHGRRLHPSVKEELLDLMSLEVDREVIKKYFESLTGYPMSNTYFANMLMSMMKNKVARQFSLEKLKEMSKKIERIKIDLGIMNEQEIEDNPDDEYSPNDQSSKLMEVFKVLNSVTAPKKIPRKRKRQILNKTDVDSEPPPAKQSRNDGIQDTIENVSSSSRLETRLQLLKHDQETLENIKHIQESVRTEKNPWTDDKNTIESKRRDSSGYKVKCRKTVYRGLHDDIKPVHEQVEEAAVDTPEVTYEVTIEENVGENDIGYIVYDNNEETLPNELVNMVASNASYCIQYEHNDMNVINGPCNVLENLGNVPVHVQATELATVNIMPENDQESDANLTENTQYSNTNVEDEMEHNVLNLIGVDDKTCNGALNLEESNVYEVIETNDKKIFPNRDIVHNVILNKPIVKPRKSKETDLLYKLEAHNAKSQSKFKNYKNELVGDLSDYGVHMDPLEENERYIIVFDSDCEENETSDKNNATSDEDDDKSEWTQLSNSLDTRTQHIDVDKLKETISKLQILKHQLKGDVKKLLDVKNKLLQEIVQAKTLKKVISQENI